MVGQQPAHLRASPRRAKAAKPRRAEAPPAPEAPARGQDSLLFVNSVEKALRVLYAFGERHASLSLSEIARSTGMGISAAQRFVHTLHSLGYLLKDARTRRYRLGVRLLDFAFLYQRSSALGEMAIHHLVSLSEQSGQTVHMVERDGVDIVYIARLPRREVRFPSGVIGTRMPAFCTGTGRAILSALPEEDAATLLAGSTRPALTAHTLTEVPAIMQQLREARRVGYAIVDREVRPDEMALAAPIFDYAGEPVAAVGFTVPVADCTLARASTELAPLIVDTARAISRALGNMGAFAGA
jgi:DNA-binding IclR family transcriptional regulator